MKQSSACSYLDEALKHGIKLGQKRIKALLKELGAPHLKYKVVLVTGTNGKSSTARFVSSLLSSQGGTTGLYTSPHFDSYCERIEVDGKRISESDLDKTINDIKPAIEKVNKNLNDFLTNFEILTAGAFYYFARRKVDCAVMEVGMGARFDATCVSPPKVSVITNVELDHTDYLGETVEEIAGEKMHVIKKGTRVVLGPLSNEARSVIKKRAKEQKANLHSIKKDFDFDRIEGNQGGQKINVDAIFADYEGVEIKAVGQNQAMNFSLALVAAELIIENSLNTDFINPIKKLSIDGRMEIIQTGPTILLDGAHNPSGALSLKEALVKDFRYKKLTLILAIYKDKDCKSIIRNLAPLANKVIFSENSSQRSFKANKLAKVIWVKNHKVISSLSEAIGTAKNISSPNDLICITGSLGTVADARNILKKEE